MHGKVHDYPAASIENRYGCLFPNCPGKTNSALQLCICCFGCPFCALLLWLPALCCSNGNPVLCGCLLSAVQTEILSSTVPALACSLSALLHAGPARCLLCNFLCLPALSFAVHQLLGFVSIDLARPTAAYANSLPSTPSKHTLSCMHAAWLPPLCSVQTVILPESIDSAPGVHCMFAHCVQRNVH